MDLICPKLTALLIDSAIKGTILLTLVALAVRFLAHHRPVWRGLLWSSALAALVLLPVASALFPPLQIPLWASGHIQALTAAPLIPATGSTTASSTGAFPAWIYAVTALYFAGLVVSFVRIGVGGWRVNRLRRDIQAFGDTADMTRLRRWCTRLGINIQVDLGISDRVSVPTVIGVWRPLIVIPPALAAHSSAQTLDGVIVHELAHIKRRDTQWNLVGLLVTTLYWYHPLVHLVRHSLAEAREYACDDWAVEILGDAHAYATTLLDVAARMDRRLAVALGIAMARTARVLDRTDRIVTLGGHVTPRAGRLATVVTIIAIFTTAAVLGCLNPGARTSKTPPRTVIVPSEESLPKPEEFVAFEEPPSPISIPQPKYPETALKAGVEGMVILHILIDKSGKVQDVRIVKGANPDLDKAAMEAVRQSTWKPAMRNHEPVAVWVSFPVRFKLP